MCELCSSQEQVLVCQVVSNLTLNNMEPPKHTS